MTIIPASHLDLLKDETRAFACLATLMADGSPQLTPLWFSADGDFILINSARGRVKDRNMRARPRVALLIVDPQDPYRFVQMRGRIVEITEHDALQHINALALKYRQGPWTPIEGQTRVIYRILPEHVTVE